MFKKNKPGNFLDTGARLKSVLGNIPYVKNRRRRFYFFDLLRYVSLGVMVIVIVSSVIIGANFGNLKLIYMAAMAGKTDAESAVNLIKNKNFKEAGLKAEAAQKNFHQAFLDLSRYQKNYFISRLAVLSDQVNNFVYLLNTAEILSRAVGEMSVLGSNLNWFIGQEGFNFSKLDKSEKRKLLADIYEAGPELAGIKADVDLALLNLKYIKANGLLWPFKKNLFALTGQIGQIDQVLGQAVPVAQILPSLLGYPNNSVYLILLQNNDELRPTGGFIGTYGILEMSDGDIKRFDTHDIYHMDMPVKDAINIEPPAPIKKYLAPKWYMRDSNWSPDWPTAAAKIQWFYQQENALLPAKNQINNFSGDFSGVIGITPELIIDLLKLTGPLAIEGQKYNDANFMDLLQYRVEKGYEQLGVPSWQRKEVIGDIFELLKIKLFELPAKEMLNVLNIITVRLQEKDILLFFNDPELQSFADQQSWSGRLAGQDGDFLMIVDANLGSFKTDAVISRSFDYKIKQEPGNLTAELEINYMHKGGFDWKTTRYRTYTRIYTPLGSRLVKAEGYSEGTVDVYNEGGKTVFGVFLSVEPGQIGKLNFIYELPGYIINKIKNSGYKLYYCKQPGAGSVYSSVDLEFINSVKSYNPTGFYVNKYDDGVRWEGESRTDMEYSVEF